MSLHDKRQNGLVYVTLYVDDNLYIGNDKAIDKTIKALRKAGLVLKVYDLLEHYLLCEIKF